MGFSKAFSQGLTLFQSKAIQEVGVQAEVSDAHFLGSVFKERIHEQAWALTVMVLKHWNSLRVVVVDSPLLGVFRTKLDVFVTDSLYSSFWEQFDTLCITKVQSR